MGFTMQVKLVPSSINKYTMESKKENQIEYETKNQYTQSISDHSVIPSNSNTTYDKK